MKTLVISRIFK